MQRKIEKEQVKKKREMKKILQELGEVIKSKEVKDY